MGPVRAGGRGGSVIVSGTGRDRPLYLSLELRILDSFEEFAGGIETKALQLAPGTVASVCALSVQLASGMGHAGRDGTWMISAALLASSSLSFSRD
jgi:hypothetical protein